MFKLSQSPTGDMNINSLRIAILTYLLSQQKNDNFLIRINDLDKDKNIEGKDTEIMQILEKFALKHESVYHQSERLHMHQTLAIRLLEEGKAFISTSSDEQANTSIAQLKADKTPFMLKIKNNDSSLTILNTDGTPTQNFAAVCDDILDNINYVIFEDLQLSDIKEQKHIKSLLDYNNEVTYVNIPTIIDIDGVSIKFLFEEGFVPDAIINYLLLLSDSKLPNEIFTLPEVIESFNIDNIKSEAKFDLNKLKLINKEHLKMMDNKTLSKVFNFADEDIGKLAKLYLEEYSTIKELKSKIEPIFKPKNFVGEYSREMKTLKEIIQNAPMINDFNEFKAYIIKHSGLNEETMLKPLRLLLTGATKGPELSKIYPHIKSYILEVAS